MPGTERQAPGASILNRAQTILVVGTSQQRRAATIALLAQAGHATRELDAIADVLPLVEAERPALVVLDMGSSNSGSPDLGSSGAIADGEAAELIRAVKRSLADTFVLQIAAGPMEGASEGLVDAFLLDPIDPRELLVLVRSLLRLQQVEVELRHSEERLQLARDAAGLAVLDWAVPTGALAHSSNLLDLFDRAPPPGGGALTSSALLERLHPEDLPSLLDDFATGSRTSDSFEKEFRILRRNGSVRWIAARGRFFPDAAGEPERMLAYAFDVTQRKTAEHANAMLAAVVNSSTDAILSVDGGGSITSWNAGAEALFGLSATESVGQPLAAVFSDTPPEERETYRRRIAEGEPHEFETRQQRRDRPPVDVWVTSAPIRDRGGRIMGASLFVRDMSAHRQREDHVRFLMRELTHRSKNLLAVIQAMARQSLAKDIAPEEFVRRFSSRLAGLAGSHDLLSSVQYKGVSLTDLISSQLNHYEDLFGSRIVLNGEDLTVRPEAAQNIGVALHELSTNAAKYGALSNEAGVVTITWALGGDPVLFDLDWRESGGPPVVEPTRRGFGSIVMNRIAGQAMSGRSGIRFDPDGVHWTLSVPANSAVVPPPPAE